jgi:hypothetical protein
MDQVVKFPEYAGKIYINPAQNFEDSDVKIFVVRDHHARVLSTYFDKLVINDSSQWANGKGWRAMGHSSPPVEVYGPKHSWETFNAYTANLGMAQSREDHVKPYLAWGAFAFAFWKAMSNDQYISTVVTLRQVIDGDVLILINEFLGLHRSTGLDHLTDMLELTKAHKICYSRDLPPPQHYQSNVRYWSDVHRENLYRCYQETGAVPAIELMYEDPQVATAISNQLGYRLDDYEIRQACVIRVCDPTTTGRRWVDEVINKS